MAAPNGHSFKQRVLLAILPRFIAGATRLLVRTWRVQVIAPPQSLPGGSDGPMVYAMWHEDLVAVVGNWRDHAIQGLASQSFDGELISQIMVHLGYPALARGSSTRGGEGGLSGHLEALRLGRHVVVTMDGPRGPRRVCKPGTVLIGARSGRPLVPVLCEASPALRLRSWDKSLIPLPFARVVFVLGEPIAVERGGVEAAQAALDQQMARLSAQASARIEESKAQKTGA